MSSVISRAGLRDDREVDLNLSSVGWGRPQGKVRCKARRRKLKVWIVSEIFCMSRGRSGSKNARRRVLLALAAGGVRFRAWVITPKRLKDCAPLKLIFVALSHAEPSRHSGPPGELIDRRFFFGAGPVAFVIAIAAQVPSGGVKKDGLTSS